MLLIRVVVFVLVSIAVSNGVSDFPVKHLAGLPEEFSDHRVPDPSLVITDERSASSFIWFQSAADSGIVYTATVPVDGPNEFVFTFASPHEAELELELMDPSGKIVDLTKYQKKSTFSLGTDFQVPVSAYTVTDSVRGYYKLNIKSSTLTNADLEVMAESAYPNAVLTVFNNDYVEIRSHLNSYVIKQGQEIGIVSTIVDLSPTATISDINVTSAMMEVITPDGQDVEIAMTDTDALLEKFGIAPHSGVYAARFHTQSSGEYIVQALLQGLYSDTVTNTDEVPFLRSTEHIIEVSPATLSLTGSSVVRAIDPEHVAIDIQTTGTGDKLRAYAEVWGVDVETNQPKAACWIGGVVENVNNAVTLELDLKWLLLSGVKPPLTLHNVYVSDLTTSFPVSMATSAMDVQFSEEVIRIDSYSSAKIEITDEMRQGRNPLKGNVVAVDAAPTLLLLPGYCSTSNPFQENANMFTDAAFFTTGGGNFGHQEFAEKAMAFAQSKGMNSYSVIGHSQGGMVGLHMRNFYFTGLDIAAGTRLIQSVGTPYQGCTAAGSLANLGKIFGVACGSNNDLSLDGATNWLTGITQNARVDVNYYTTTYKQGNLLGDSCSLAMNLILQWPNDGTTETKYATLTHAKNLGNTQQWCHTTGMNYPPQYTDNTRNAEMNKLAAR